jgi:hypothetical protein
MAQRPEAGDRLFATRWVHLYEQDTAEGEVYAPEDGAIPLSRRPRERLELKPDGSGTFYEGGGDDRLSGRPARWSEGSSDIVLEAAAAGRSFRIVERSPHRIVVKRGS